MSATPRPWVGGIWHDYPAIFASDQASEPLAEFRSSDDRDAVLHCVNSYTDLVVALQAVLHSACLHPRDMDGEARQAVSRATAILEGLITEHRAALAKAKGEPA